MKRFLSAGLMTFVALGTADASHAGHRFSATQLFAFGDPATPVPGAATLLRTPRGLEMTLSVGDLAPGHVYTVWWILFNNTGGCEAPIPAVSLCGSADVGRPSARTATIWAASAIADDSGTARFTGSLARGRVPQGMFVSSSGVGRLISPLRAEVHLVGVRHPTPQDLVSSGEVDEAITTPSGGCGVADGCASEFAGIFVP